MKKQLLWLALACVIVSLLGCSQKSNIQTAQDYGQGDKKEPPIYTIQPGDELDIKFFYNPELNETLTVRPDGKISLQLLDDVQAAGLTPAQLDEDLTQKYAKELKKPVITVIVRSFAGQRVYVGGEVNRESLLELRPGTTALQAVFEAGGFAETAQPQETIVIRKGPDNRPVPVRLDLAAAMKGSPEAIHFYLQPDDVVYVPKSAIAEANKFVNQYIERLILFRGFSFGVTYQINEVVE
jgi:protein involved in polysaccharide export with SLBB domain